MIVSLPADADWTICRSIELLIELESFYGVSIPSCHVRDLSLSFQCGVFITPLALLTDWDGSRQEADIATAHLLLGSLRNALLVLWRDHPLPLRHLPSLLATSRRRLGLELSRSLRHAGYANLEEGEKGDVVNKQESDGAPKEIASFERILIPFV